MDSKLTRRVTAVLVSTGFLLLGVFPTDIVTSVSVGTFLAANGDPVTDAAGFVLLTLFILALPSLSVLVLGKASRGRTPEFVTG